MEPKFILSKSKLLEQVTTLKNLGLKISYSYKTNREVGNVLQEISDCDFSIHAKEEIDMIKDKSRIWFFTQAEPEEELKEILKKGIKNFVIDNEIDLERILNVLNKINVSINLSLRMKFQEHRIGSGKYFVYGMSSKKINEIIARIKDSSYIDKIGVHIHRKSQNTSEWEIKEELEDSLTKESLERIDFLNFGGGLPAKYRSYVSEVLVYIFKKITNAKEFLEKYNIKTYIEPGRFFAAPCIKLETEIIQIQKNNLIINTTIYNCALDTVLTGTKMLVEGEIEDSAPKGVPPYYVPGTRTSNEVPPDIQDGILGGKDEKFYLIKGNSPTRDDIFRYKVKLKNPKVGDKIVFLNAGAYNYTTDFFGYKKLKTEVGSG
ncbi:decarboxylase [Candidatus Pacearchaeota archaeon]|nr:decarboxylase [Candidatus Pacearchaeota archaeon]